MKSNARSAIVGAAVIFLAGVLWTTASRSDLKMLTYSQFLDQVRAGHVASAIVMDRNSGATQATCRLQDGSAMRTVLPSDYKDALVAMQEKLVNIEIRDSSSGLLSSVLNAAPFLLLSGVWIVLMIRKFPNGPRQGVLG